MRFSSHSSRSCPSTRNSSRKSPPEPTVRRLELTPPLRSQAEEIGLWQLRDQEPLNQWAKGRTIIVGDSAHAMLPHQGQGAAAAIEDAEALGYVLRNATRDQVPALLQKVFRLRYRRATMVQQASRAAGLGDMMKKNSGFEGGELPKEFSNMMKFRQFNMAYLGAEDWEKNHDEWVLPESAVQNGVLVDSAVAA